MMRLDKDWEEDLDRELKSLSNARAPRTLLPRILAAAEAQARQPAWLREWYRLPLWSRALVLAAASAAALWVLRSQIGFLASASGPWLTTARALSKVVAHVFNVTMSLWWTWRVPLGAAAMASVTTCAVAVVMIGVVSKSSQPVVGRRLT